MPRGLHNAYIFDIFNTVSWTVVLASPMLLFFQHLHATATVLAIAASLSPLLVILQIPAARYVERVGYRRFVLSGWTTRSFFVIGMMVVAFLPPGFDRTTRVVLMLFLSFFYNALRGISTCGLLPWFTHIVPEERRGEFLAKDQFGIAFASIVSLLFYGLLLRGGGQAWYSFGVVFATSAVAAFVSLAFLKRIPDVPVEKIITNPNPMPWLEMFFYPPFFHYLRFNVVINMALGGSNVFWVRYFRVFLHVSDSYVLIVAAAGNVVLAITLFLVASVIDRTGNRQILALAGSFFAVHFTGWALVAAGILPFNLPVLLWQTLTSGVGWAFWNISNVRAVMNIVPAMGRPHFLALYSVVSSLTLGLVPLFWGPVLDGLEQWRVNWGPWHWNCYSFFYCTLAATVGVGLFLLRTVAEPVRMTWDVFAHALLVETPSRAVSRLIGRLRSPGNG
jgi:MFS family permease